MAAGAAILLFMGLYILYLFLKSRKFKTVFSNVQYRFITLGFIFCIICIDN